MGDTNYFSGIVKILETPRQNFITDQTSVITFRVELPENRKNKIITLKFWGNLGHDVKNFYKVNDYILTEGYISLQSQQNIKTLTKNSKQVVLTVLRVYPILLNPNRS
jgi:hypothetical protein